jgi:surface antigen
MSNPLSQDPSQNLLPSTSFSALNWEPQEPNPVVVLQSDLLIGHINQNPNITAVTPNPSDSLLLAQIEGSIATIDPNITLPNDNSFDGLTGEAMDIVKEQLTQFAKVPNFVEKMNLAFGESWDNQAANVLTQDWLNGDFSLIPPVKFVSSTEIAGANGAFAAATDTIYLSRELLAGNGANPATVADVLLEEIGHSVDARLNVTDTPGDEGAIFAAVVQGKVLSEGELQGLRGEDDSGTFIFNGQAISIEKAFDWGNNWGVQSWNWNGNSKSWEPLWNGKAKDFGSATRSDGKKGFAQDWGDGSPGNGVNNDFFLLGFWTQADFEKDQSYKFQVRADDRYYIAAYPVNNGNKWELINWEGKEDAYGGKEIQWKPENNGKYWLFSYYMERDGNAYFDISWDKISNSSPVESNNNSQVYTAQAFVNSWQNLPEYTNRNPFPDKGQNCTWYAHGRMLQLGYSKAALDTMWGNAGTWDNTAKNGATVSNTPQAPSIAVWEPGVGGAGGVGHVAVVERVNSDGSILISESNWDKTQYNTRTISRNSRYWPSEFITVPKA